MPRRTSLAASLVLTVALAPSIAHAVITYHSDVGWYFGGGDSGSATHDMTVPTMAGTGDFHAHGQSCDPADANYVCANSFAAAEDLDGALVLRASARVAGHGPTGPAFAAGYLTHAEAQVTICGLTGGGPAPVAKYVRFNIGLSGTASQSKSDAALNAQAFGVARFQGVIVQCIGENVVCSPTPVPWESGGCYSLGLRADAAIGVPGGFSAPWEAQGNADFADTLKLLAIEALDENQQFLPDVQFTVSDQQGTPIMTFPNVVTTSTTTTTLPGGGSTTTTLPGACGAGATYASVRCRLDALAATAGGAGSLAAKLGAKLTAARSALDLAEQVVGDNHGKATKRALKKASKQLAAFRQIVGSKKARKLIPEPTRTALTAPLSALRTDLKSLPTA